MNSDLKDIQNYCASLSGKRSLLAKLSGIIEDAEGALGELEKEPRGTISLSADGDVFLRVFVDDLKVFIETQRKRALAAAKAEMEAPL